MRRLHVVYNPKSQRGKFAGQMDKLIGTAQKHGFQVSFYRLGGVRRDAENMLAGLDDQSVVIAAGGDGTLQMVASAFVKHDLDLPIGLLPYGTSNDFGDFLGLDTDINNLFSHLESGMIQPIDLGFAGDSCFVNVFSAGQLTRTSHEVERRYKNQLGMLAYYLHGVGNLPRITPFRLRVRGQLNLELNCLLFLATNGGSAGGFRNLAPRARLDDGLLEIIIVRECSWAEMAGVFWGVLRGEHQNNPSVVYTQASSLEIIGPDDIATDVDGEWGPALPTTLRVLPARLRLIGPTTGQVNLD